jgi:hypothetical protein
MACRTVLMVLVLGFILIPASTLEVHADYQDGVDAYKAGDYEKAYQELILEAEEGDTDAQYYIGLMYWNGYGVEQDKNKAMEWFKRSSNNHENSIQRIRRIRNKKLEEGLSGFAFLISFIIVILIAIFIFGPFNLQ